MSLYLEIPELHSAFPFRTFINDGWEIVYPHWHKEIEVIYCLTGTVKLGAFGEIFELAEGEIFFFPSGEPHFFLASPDSQRIVFQFDLRFFYEQNNLVTTDRTLLQLFDEAPNYSRDWPTSAQKEINQLLRAIFNCHEEKNEGWQYGVTGLLTQFIYALYQLAPKDDVKQSKVKENLKSRETLELLDQIFEYVEANFDSPITLEAAARQVGFSETYFSRFFKQKVGIPFSQYLKEYRIEQAKFLLATEHSPMSEIAAKAGFANVKTFHHVFKKTVGCAPLQYQKQLK